MNGSQKYTYIIKRRDKDNTRWKVVPADNPEGRPVPGDELTWHFDQAEKKCKGLEAHFQFCHFVMEKQGQGPPTKVCFLDSPQINQDWVGVIPNSTGELTGILRGNVPQQRALHNAVWIRDPEGPEGKQGINDFAIGDNPPPDVKTGP